ncbi:MAG: IS1634 family transposase [Firmicutes bacterium]|nr:IS1634 family transposase [Bacillota bacterium]
MRLSIVRSAHSTSYAVIKSAYKNKKITSVVVERLGNDKYIRETYGVDDPEAWARAHVEELNRLAEEEKAGSSISFSPSAQIAMNEQRSYNLGYLFLQNIFYQLGLHKICTTVKKRHSFEYNLTSILSRLIYTRILFPGSKRSSFKDSSLFVEQPDFDLHQIYRALSVLASESDYIQQTLYKNSLALSGRKTSVIYYDCTNYYFEIEEADPQPGLRQYGYSKENRPNPITQMGLFMDSEGIPLAFCINPGNTNEQTTLKPLERKLISDFSLSKFVVCTDAGLSSLDNRVFNNISGRAYITVQSLKKAKAFQKEWAMDPKGWKLLGDDPKKLYDISSLDESEDYEKIFYKERWFNENGLEQRFIVTYSLKYRDYLASVRGKQYARAIKKVSQFSGKDHYQQNDPDRFIEQLFFTEDGEVATEHKNVLNEERLREEASYDGFYAVATNLEDDASSIIRINQRRWEIEECFRIMKHEFIARPCYVSRDDRITAHFMICFLALIVFRYLEKSLDNEYTVQQIIDTLRSMNALKVEGRGYIPTYERTELTDLLHEKYHFTTSTQIIPIAKMRNICKQTKSPGKEKS